MIIDALIAKGSLKMTLQLTVNFQSKTSMNKSNDQLRIFKKKLHEVLNQRENEPNINTNLT